MYLSLITAINAHIRETNGASINTQYLELQLRKVLFSNEYANEVIQDYKDYFQHHNAHKVMT